MRKLIDMFLWSRQAQRLISENTLKAYRQDLMRFDEFMQKHKYTAINAEIVQKFFVFLSQSSQVATQARRMNVVVQCLKFCMEENLIPKFTIELPKLKQHNLFSVFMENDDLNKIRVYLTQQNDLRLSAIIETLYSTGLRISELLALKISDFEQIQKDKCLLITGKGQRQRTVFFNDLAIENIQKHMATKKNTEKIFDITRQRVFQMLKKLAIDANVPTEKIFPHSFRHRMLTDLVKGGADIVSIQKIAGHQQLSTTARYTHVEEQLYDDILKFHPLAKLDV